MTARFVKCETCQTGRSQIMCDGCGADVTTDEEAVRIDVHRVTSSQRTTLDYCRSCAARELPLAVGIAPGSDLPASLDPPEPS